MTAACVPIAVTTPVALDRAVVEPLRNWSPDEQEAYEERAAIMEFDGGLPWHEAERKAAANRKDRHEVRE